LDRVRVRRHDHLDAFAVAFAIGLLAPPHAPVAVIIRERVRWDYERDAAVTRSSIQTIAVPIVTERAQMGEGRHDH
jgi:hypothetical protein